MVFTAPCLVAPPVKSKLPLVVHRLTLLPLIVTPLIVALPAVTVTLFALELMMLLSISTTSATLTSTLPFAVRLEDLMLEGVSILVIGSYSQGSLANDVTEIVSFDEIFVESSTIIVPLFKVTPFPA